MIVPMDRLMRELPVQENASPNCVQAVQALAGGTFGGTSTLMNYKYQAFNVRRRTAYRPFDDFLTNIATEEHAHIQLVSYAINLLMTGSTTRGIDPTDAPPASAVDARKSYHFPAAGQWALPMGSQGNGWTGQQVFSSGNPKLDVSA